MPSKQCPKCTGSMSEGLIADQTNQSAAAVPIWVEGEPERNFWTGLKLRGKPRFDVATWRCSRCGFLEQYAAAEPNLYNQAKKQVQLVVLAAAIVAAIVAAVGVGLLAH
jgi:hypothetical protein